MSINNVLCVIALNLTIFALTIMAVLVALLISKFMILVLDNIGRLLYETVLNGPCKFGSWEDS